MKRPTDQQIRQWYPRLFRTALRMVGDVDHASDLTQEALCKAFGRWDDFDGKVLTTTWLYRILLNCVRDWPRRQDVRRSQSLDELPVLPASAACGAQEQLHRREQTRAVREAIRGLPAAQRITFVFAVIDGYSYQEVADLLSVPVGTVASRIHEARKLVRAAVRSAFPED